VRRNFAHIESVGREFKKILEQSSRPTAIVASNDKVAIALMQTAQELGVDVPNDISIVGFDDIPMASLVSPALTTIRTDISAMGRIAATMLLDKIKASNNLSKGELKVLMPKLIMRSSLVKVKK
jgi:LacI family transcriptional regulator